MFLKCFQKFSFLLLKCPLKLPNLGIESRHKAKKAEKIIRSEKIFFFSKETSINFKNLKTNTNLITVWKFSCYNHPLFGCDFIIQFLLILMMGIMLWHRMSWKWTSDISSRFILLYLLVWYFTTKLKPKLLKLHRSQRTSFLAT